MPTGIKDLTLYPLGPTAVVLSWNRPFLGVFRKYVVEMFYFNPSTMTSEWTTYYEIAATISLTASVVMWLFLTIAFSLMCGPGTLGHFLIQLLPYEKCIYAFKLGTFFQAKQRKHPGCGQHLFPKVGKYS